jgi:hypothetical protein
MLAHARPQRPYRKQQEKYDQARHWFPSPNVQVDSDFHLTDYSSDAHPHQLPRSSRWHHHAQLTHSVEVEIRVTTFATEYRSF